MRLPPGACSQPAKDEFKTLDLPATFHQDLFSVSRATLKPTPVSGGEKKETQRKARRGTGTIGGSVPGKYEVERDGRHNLPPDGALRTRHARRSA